MTEVKKYVAAMSPQREWIRENMKKRTSPNTIRIQEARRVESMGGVFWNSTHEGTYRK